MHKLASRIIENISQVMVGHQQAIIYLTAALLAETHVLIEDVPGVGKTTLAKSLAQSIDCTFQRIQFTPDLVPADVTGSSIYQQATGEFTFRPGPIMSNIVLADEINRASPKTQSSLLESMEERQVTVDGKTHNITLPFLVLATQNSVEYEGTFPLPEAQLDRFSLRLDLGYPSPSQEMTILRRLEGEHPLGTLKAVANTQDVMEMQGLIKKIHVSDAVREYLVALASASRQHPDIELGLSPRATLHLFRLSQALAWIRQRDYVLPDDVKELAKSACSHRLLLRPEARWGGTDAQTIITSILEQTPVPGARGT